ncbi:hypothetical protein [Aestuariivirga sp.]|uniref:hypothetical protein n=1 Tax=Aestuariivirga sp. TaxID=2650926 RepID=UPI003BAD4918
MRPQVGGTITHIRHKETGLSVLGDVPWDTVDVPLATLAARDEPEWLTRYTGGWPLLFPNSGDACMVDGVFHGFHGEASIAPWDVVTTGAHLVLERQFSCLSAAMRRTFSLHGEILSIREQLSYSGNMPIDVMWGHHPTFGSDLLASPYEVTAGAREVLAEPQYDPTTNPLKPGAKGHWPMLAGKSGIADLAHPQYPWASVVYLTDFRSPWAAIRRSDNAIAVMLSWDGALFPCAWLWYELKGTVDAPWSGRTMLIGIEPNTTPCSLGLGEAVRRNAPLLRLIPGMELTTTINLHVFRPSGPILDGPAAHP